MYKPPNIRTDDELQRELTAIDNLLTEKQDKLSRIMRTKQAPAYLATKVLALMGDMSTIRLDNCALAYLSLNLPPNSIRRRKLDALAERHREVYRSMETLLSSLALLHARRYKYTPPVTLQMILSAVTAQSIRSYWTFAPWEEPKSDGTHTLAYRTDLDGVRCLPMLGEAVPSDPQPPSYGAISPGPITDLVQYYTDRRTLWLFRAPHAVEGWNAAITNGASFIPTRQTYFPTSGSYYSVRSVLQQFGLWYDNPRTDAGFILKRLRLKRGGC